MNKKLLNAGEEKIISYIRENRDELFCRLSDLVNIDTVNYRTYGNENNGQDYLEKICTELGLTVDRFAPETVPGVCGHRDYRPGRGADSRANLVAFMDGETTKETIMLASHMDTEYLGDEEKWTDSPLSGAIKNGKLYGRGSADDKSGIAVSWYIMKAFKDCGILPPRNLMLAAYSDEEAGGVNGALALALKYPSDFCINLDSGGFETEAPGGGCFKLKIKSLKNDKAVASVFDVFRGVNLVVEKLEELSNRPKTHIRLSNVQAGMGGVKEGVVNLAIFTDMTKEVCQEELDNICNELKGEFEKLDLATEGFKLTTRFFIYGETSADSKEAEILAEILKEETGEYPDTNGKNLSDLSLIMAYGCKNSFNYGVPRGSKEGGGAHQPNEHAVLDELVRLAENVALVIMRS